MHNWLKIGCRYVNLDHAVSAEDKSDAGPAKVEILSTAGSLTTLDGDAAEAFLKHLSGGCTDATPKAEPPAEDAGEGAEAKGGTKHHAAHGHGKK